uniref:SAM domain-containing protein n=1 Tax=Romanomermis culicivorax TaxID=13658 RepID=A0A915IU74_ROMCU
MELREATVTEWLSALDLIEYSTVFSSQGYDTMDKIMQMIFEDFEDVGVKKLGHLKKFLCALKKIKDGRQSNNNNNQRKSTISFDSSCSSSSSNNNIIDQATEVLVINHHTANGHKSQSPYAMVTFQQSPKPLSQSQDLSDCHARSPVPTLCPSPMILSPSHRCQTLSPEHSKGMIYFNNNGNGYGQLWQKKDQSSMTNGHLVRAPSVEGVKYPSPSHLIAHSRRENGTPSVSTTMAGSSESVLLTQSTIPSAPRFRSCRRNDSPASSTNYRRSSTNGGYPTTFSSSSCENLMQKSLSNYGGVGGAVTGGSWVAAGAPELSRRKSVQQTYSPGKNNYVRLENGKMVSERSQNPISSDSDHNLHVPCSSTASIFRRNGGPVLSKAGEPTTELSPAPSMEDFPPPPDPLMCEEHIKQLRTINFSCNENYNTLQQNPWPSNQQKTRSLSLTTAPSCLKSPLLNTQRQATIINGNDTESCLSINSNSSSEALPFANENIGTIRQKLAENGLPAAGFHTNNDNYDVCQLTLKQKIFSRPPIGKVFEENGRNCSTENRSSTRKSKPGNVLNDIGHMLQDLTDELDALLCDPSAKSQKVN